METFERSTALPFPREDVFDWFVRPGALVRLTPPFGGRVLREPTAGLQPGSEAEVAVGPPGSLGLAGAALSAIGPAWARPQLRWRARHVALEPGRAFSDEMVTGPPASWRHVHTFADADADAGVGTVMTDRITYGLPRALDNGAGRRAVAAELVRIFDYRARQVAADLDFGSTLPSAPRRIAVTGASGMIGRQVCALLEGAGHDVVRLVRRPPRTSREAAWDPEAGVLDPAVLEPCDAVVHLAGHTIGGRFTAANKQRILDSRVDGTTLVARTLADLAADGRPRTLVSASAIGYYGARPGTGPLAEDSPAGDDFLASVCLAWERACDPARDAGLRVVNVRTGLVLTPAGGMLTRLLPLYLAGLGGPLGRNEWQSWIGIDDIASIFATAALDGRFAGPVNGVAPEPVTASEFAQILGRVLRRPSRIPVPAFGPRLLLGAEGAGELAAADQLVAPAALDRAGFRFRHTSLEAQLRHVLGR